MSSLFRWSWAQAHWDSGQHLLTSGFKFPYSALLSPLIQGSENWISLFAVYFCILYFWVFPTVAPLTWDALGPTFMPRATQLSRISSIITRTRGHLSLRWHLKLVQCTLYDSHITTTTTATDQMYVSSQNSYTYWNPNPQCVRRWGPLGCD